MSINTRIPVLIAAVEAAQLARIAATHIGAVLGNADHFARPVPAGDLKPSLPRGYIPLAAWTAA